MRAAAVNLTAIAFLLLTATLLPAQDSLPRPPVFDSTRVVRVNPPIVANGSIPGIAAIVNREYIGDNGGFYFYAYWMFRHISDIREPMSRVSCWRLKKDPSIKTAEGQDRYVLEEWDQFTFPAGQDSIRVTWSRHYPNHQEPGKDTTLPRSMLENNRRLRREHPVSAENIRLEGDSLFFYRNGQLSNCDIYASDGRIAAAWSFSDGDTLVNRYHYDERRLLQRFERTGPDGKPFWVRNYSYNELNLITRIEQQVPDSGYPAMTENWSYHYYVTPDHHFVIEKSAVDRDIGRHIPVERYTFDERFHWIAVENFSQHYTLLRRLEYQ